MTDAETDTTEMIDEQDTTSEQNSNVVFDSAAFEEWVENAAESKDSSPGEVFDQMLSSYWILDELAGMMDESEQGGTGAPLQGGTTGGDSGREGDCLNEDGASELIREFQDLRSAVLELTERPETEEHGVASGGQMGDHEVSASSHRRTDERLRTTLSELQERVEYLSEEVSEVQDRHDRDVGALQADIEETLDTLEALESSVDNLVGHSEFESLAVSLKEELSRIEDATGEVEGRLTQLEDVQSQTAGEVTDLAEGQSELEARLDREFDSIENLFQHLLDKTDDLEHRFEALPDSPEEDIESVEEAVAERERLATVIRQANRKGVSTAVCDNCETKVDLRLLHEPYCPGCDCSISGVEPGGWLPFNNATLETEPID